MSWSVDRSAMVLSVVLLEKHRAVGEGLEVASSLRSQSRYVSRELCLGRMLSTIVSSLEVEKRQRNGCVD